MTMEEGEKRLSVSHKVIVVSIETHSQLFSIKNNLVVTNNKKFTYDEVMKRLISYYKFEKELEPLKDMYQLEEKQ